VESKWGKIMRNWLVEQSREEAAWLERRGEKAPSGVGGESKQRSREE
jgi:hypothetical protein